jgi:hypothetical protein
MEGLRAFSLTADGRAISVAGVRIAEGSNGVTQANFKVSLARIQPEPVSVDFATENGTAVAGEDYVATSGTVTFAPGERTKTVSVTVTADAPYEPDEVFYLRLSNPVNGVLSATPLAGCYITESTISVADVRIAEGTNGVVQANFTISLNQSQAGPVSVDFATENGTAVAGEDYIATSGTVTFAPGERTNLTSRIRPSINKFSIRKRLICRRGSGEKQPKGLVVQTYPVPKENFFCIIDCQHVPALDDAKEEWEGASVFFHRGKQTCRRRAGGPTSCALPGRDKRPTAGSLAQNDRDLRGGTGPTQDCGVVSRRKG